jgi:putative DNA primase/helicase
MGSVLDCARRYVAAGLSVIPVRADGSKRPALASWKEFQERPAADGVLKAWFADDLRGIAIICGRVSGGLEVLDFETADAFAQWSVLIERQLPGLLARLPQVRTPSGGMHVYYRSGGPKGNAKLARAEAGKTVVETRGEGGYVLAPGCPPACHPTGGLYEHVAGPCLTAVPTLGELRR